MEPPINYFHMTWHNVAGGMLSGSGDNLLRFNELFDQQLHQMITEKWCQLDGVLTACIVRQYPELFDYYYGDYCGIIDNYCRIVDLTNVGNIIQKYLDHQMYTEAQTVPSI